MKKYWAVALILLATMVTNVFAENSPTTIDAGVLIDNVIGGADYSGQEIIVSGVALGATSASQKLLNLATQRTYKSGHYDNYISIYDTRAKVNKGSSVTIKMQVETSTATKMGAQVFVVVEGVYLACLSCK